MATDKRQFTMRMQQENFDKLRFIAAANKRSMAMQIEYLLEQCISDYETAHGQINFSENKKSLEVVQNNNNGSNFISMGGNNNYSVVTQ